jgi:hypothetical protein
MNSILTFRIADLPLQILSDYPKRTILQLLPSFVPFMTDNSDAQPLFQLAIGKKAPTPNTEFIRTFDTGNGCISVARLDNSGYLFDIMDSHRYPCCQLQTDTTITHCRCTINGNLHTEGFGLNTALMLCFAFASSQRKTLLIHASTVKNQNYGYAFIAPSGTGKSTHVAYWLKNIRGCDLLNDDNPVIRMIGGKPYIFGSPWSGKTPCYRNVKVRLGAIAHIARAASNTIRPYTPAEAFAALLPSCSTLKWDKAIYNSACNTIAEIIRSTNIYNLRCLPNDSAARMAYQTIRKR